MWSVTGLIVGQNYRFHGGAGCNLYKTGDLFDPTVVEGELTEGENLLVAAINRVQYDYYGIKILAGDKLGWIFVQENDRLFELLVDHDETTENTK